MPEPTADDFDTTLQTLNYATRLLASELDAAALVDRSLDTLVDFSGCRQVALFTVEDGGTTLALAGALSPDGLTHPERRFAVGEPPWPEVLRARPMVALPLDRLAGFPVPVPRTAAAEVTDPALECLCLPLVDSHHQVIAVATLARERARTMASSQVHALTVVMTLIAASLQNARLFRLATVDGLTGLYVRRYFEIRLDEEIARLERHGGAVAVLITDIDHFKRFNDTYGHQQGDVILRELALLFQRCVRTGLDIVCRYGGEEFVTILPETGLTGATEVAERIRQRCEEYEFPGQDGPLRVTISGGVAVANTESPCLADELVGRADAALYAAKEDGRNRIYPAESR